MLKSNLGKKTAVGAEGDVTNGAEAALIRQLPYVVHFTLQGSSDLLFHRWNSESIGIKANAPKGSAAKKTDDLESYVWRNDQNEICLPGEYVRQSMINAAKYRQDPRSPRKSAMDLFKAALVSLTHLAPIIGVQQNKVITTIGDHTTVTDWDFEHSARVVIQRSGVTRVRPAFKQGWQTQFEFMVNLPEYVSVGDFHDVLMNAGRLVGVADFRPSYGRFRVTSIAQQQIDDAA